METEVPKISEKISKKVCLCCGEEKDIEMFSISRDHRNGYRSECKKCKGNKVRLWKKNNPEKVKRYVSAYQKKNRKIINKYAVEYRDKNREKILKIRKKSYQKNKQKIILKTKEWKIQNVEKVKEWSRAYCKRMRKLDPDKYRKIANLYSKKRRLEPKIKLHQRISVGVCRSLKGRKLGQKWESLVGYTCSQLMAHLEKQFKNGMSWDNIGKWNVDHKIPVSVFNFNSYNDIDFKCCWALSNLQPMWALDNLKKSNKLIKPHQPSLSFS